MHCILFCSQLRFLPPLEEALFTALRSASVAMLDPFPVGMHIAVLEALQDGVPVVRGAKLFQLFHLNGSIGFIHRVGIRPGSSGVHQ